MTYLRWLGGGRTHVQMLPDKCDVEDCAQLMIARDRRAAAVGNPCKLGEFDGCVRNVGARNRGGVLRHRRPINLKIIRAVSAPDRIFGRGPRQALPGVTIVRAKRNRGRFAGPQMRDSRTRTTAL